MVDILLAGLKVDVSGWKAVLSILG